MMICDEKRCRVTGAVTVDTTGRVLRELQPALEQGVDTLDFSGVESADSSAIALVFSAMRQAQAAGRTLTCEGLPDSFRTLAELYGVSELLPA
ncbi:MAG: STAS domain-containing protein [Thiobacillus sp.]|nr:STAS domain-containing protein [Thiobacillus sp.]